MIKKYRVHDLVKFDYSEIGEYIGENYTDRPLRNDIVVDLLNQLNDENEKLKQFNSQLARVNREGVKKVQKLAEENEQLKKEINKIKNILLDKEKDLECDYNRAAKAGMPTGGIIGELITIEDILKEMGLKND